MLFDLQSKGLKWLDAAKCVDMHIPREQNVEVSEPQHLRHMHKHCLLRCPDVPEWAVKEEIAREKQ